MEQKFQSVLDAQWGALEAHDKKIVGIRKELKYLLNELAAEKKEELIDVQSKIQSVGGVIEKTEKASHRRDSLQKSLDELNKSDLPKQLTEIDSKISNVVAEIQKLIKQKEELTARKSDLRSIYRSRLANFENSLNELNKVHGNNIDNLPKLKDEFQKLNLKNMDAQNEINAAVSGEQVWGDVCKLLKTLDHEIKGCGREQLPQISFILDKGINDLQEHLKTVEQENWMVLVVAITHEMKLLRDTLEAVRKFEKDN